MKTIMNQREARPAQTLDFCYYCGEEFSTEPDIINTPDHIPPKAVFHQDDRDWPIKVACHHRCNQERSMTDTKTAQLIGITRGQQFKPEDVRLDVTPWQPAEHEQPIGILSNLDLGAEIWRWVRGFHAALYRSYLPADRLHGICEPVPNGEITERGLRVIDHSHVRATMEQVLLPNLEAGQLDTIYSNNDKLRYACVWLRPPLDKYWGCCYCLKVYEWQNVGDPRFPRRGCFGWYTIDGEPPGGASISV